MIQNTQPHVADMPQELVINGAIYRRVGADGATVDTATSSGAHRPSVLEKLRSGKTWSLDEVSEASGLKVASLRRKVGTVLLAAGTEKRKRGRVIRVTARSVAKFLGYDLEAAQLAGARA